eukprot:GHRQ01011079.1.p1 GENE.GHRQ01011079.1~~GHRQ01011079.1.p1  ORF type:complete len:188 (+),score=38.91 GHRQ01011079.1:118-681(+)
MDTPVEDAALPMSQLAFKFNQQTQILLDRLAPLLAPRWVAWVISLLAYAVRVWLLRGFYIVTYGLGIYNLNLLLGFITPQVDPELEEGPELPTKSDQEFKPFVRRLPEFKFWWSSIKSLWIGMSMTLFTMFDVPVFWPILLLYWLLLFSVTMKRQIKHMIKYRYLPFTTGKKKYTTPGGKKEAAAAN